MSALKKELGMVAVFSLATGAMISSGLFVLPGLAFQEVGKAVVWAYALAGVLMVPTLLAKMELATAMPKSGGSYFFIERSLGTLPGTFAGLAIWFSIALKASFALIGMGALTRFFFPVLPAWGVKAVALAGCIFFTLLNIVSVRETGRLQSLMVFGLLAILGLFLIRGFPTVRDTRHLILPETIHFKSLFAVAGMVFVSFGGLTKVVDVAEEIRSPERTLPRAMSLSFSCVTVLYVVVVFVAVGNVESAALARGGAGHLAPIAYAGWKIAGETGRILVSLAALLAFVTTGNAGILSASRSPMAMSRDGLVPGFISKTNQRFGTPHIAILVTGSFMGLVIVLLSVETLVKTASTMMIVMFVLMEIAVIIMRHSGLQTYRPTFRVPLYPWLQIVTVAVYGFLIFEMGRVPLMLAGGFALLAGLWYIGYVHWRIDREAAIVFLVKRIISRHMERGGLEDELRQISLERDVVELDRFDHLLHACSILDIRESLTARELFSRVSELLCQRLRVPEQRLYELFLEREKESSTVVQPGLAIPHIIVEGEHLFEIVLVRCKEGIVFSDLHAPVKIAFILIGSPDERNYHLRVLMNIARIVQDPEFERRWFAARNAEQLRDVMLLTRRKREQQS